MPHFPSFEFLCSELDNELFSLSVSQTNKAGPSSRTTPMSNDHAVGIQNQLFFTLQ